MSTFLVCSIERGHDHALDGVSALATNQSAICPSRCDVVVRKDQWHSHGLGGLASANCRQPTVGLDRGLRTALTNR